MKLKHRYLLWKLGLWADISLWAQRRHFAIMEKIVAQAKFEIKDLQTSYFDLGAESSAEEGRPPVH